MFSKSEEKRWKKEQAPEHRQLLLKHHFPLWALTSRSRDFPKGLMPKQMKCFSKTFGALFYWSTTCCSSKCFLLRNTVHAFWHLKLEVKKIEEEFRPSFLCRPHFYKQQHTKPLVCYQLKLRQHRGHPSSTCPASFRIQGFPSVQMNSSHCTSAAQSLFTFCIHELCSSYFYN